MIQNALMGTIINLAQNFVGSNNLNLLQPLGQFGTRIHGGKDAASPRYIFTMLRSVSLGRALEVWGVVYVRIFKIKGKKNGFIH